MKTENRLHPVKKNCSPLQFPARTLMTICLYRQESYWIRHAETFKFSYAKTIKLSYCEVINDYVYSIYDQLHFLSANFMLKEVKGVTLDVPTLKHLKDNYFTDKNGLYLLSDTKSVQLEKSDGKTIIPIVTRDYIVYDGKVYSPAKGSEHRPLPLNAAKMKEVEIDDNDQICFLAARKRRWLFYG